MDTILEVPEIGFETAQKIIQQQLVLILHAHTCQKKEWIASASSSDDSDSDCDSSKGVSKCELPFCAKTKLCLDHVRECYEPANCQVSHCHATRQIIRHWKSCAKKSHCAICRPVFKAQYKHFQ